MRNKGKIDDYLYKNYMLSRGELFKITENFGIYKIEDKPLLEALKDSLQRFRNMNAYITSENKLYPPLSVNNPDANPPGMKKEKPLIISMQASGN
jgi:hypothetical protein